jgi:hypothetical protein
MRKDFGIALIEIAVAVALWAAPIAFPSFQVTSGYWIMSGTVLLLAFGLSMYWWPSKQQEVEGTAVGDDNRIQIGSISGGQNRIGHEIHHHRPQQRRMSGEMKAELLARLPNDRPVSVLGMNGNTESMNYAREIHQFLKVSGYKMLDMDATWHMYFDPPVGTVSITKFNREKEWQIVVGPAE